MAATDNLAFQLGQRPGTMYRDMSAAMVPATVVSLNSYLKKEGKNKAHPEAEAVAFYLTNHVVGLVAKRVDRDEPLGKYLSLVQNYQAVLSGVAVRLFYYLLIICTRESRHINNLQSLEDQLSKAYGPECVTFLKMHLKQGSSTSVNALLQSPPETTMGKYTDFLVDVFYKGNYQGGYGGKKWGDVAKVLREFTHGRYTAEMMVDVGWTLCHNGGPIFNKGVLYHHYDKNSLLKILDVQRAGMIPQGVAEGALAHISLPAQSYQHEAEFLLGDEVGGHVDWFVVEALGAVGHYSKEKKEQENEHGPSPVAAAKKAEAEAKKKAIETAAKALEAEEKAKYFYIMPGLKLEKKQVREEQQHA